MSFAKNVYGISLSSVHLGILSRVRLGGLVMKSVTRGSLNKAVISQKMWLPILGKDKCKKKP